MKNITAISQNLYYPHKALIIYKSDNDNGKDLYVESYDMDEKGRPINARPLNAEESEHLSKVLRVSYQEQNCFLECKGLLPDNVLYLNSHSHNGSVIWYSKAKEVNLYFKKELGIPCGQAHVPALLWKASRENLEIYALGDNKKPKLKTPLFHAPFFNISSDARVCMGTVNVEIGEDFGLIEFMNIWEIYFFDSYFSHTMNHTPVKTNIIQLWKELIASKRKFPVEVLTKHKRTLKNLLS